MIAENDRGNGGNLSNTDLIPGDNLVEMNDEQSKIDRAALRNFRMLENGSLIDLRNLQAKKRHQSDMTIVERLSQNDETETSDSESSTGNSEKESS